ncbi:uncharacterized protein LOC130813632 [Amaranthus tricolor]|uniref:uncharacterized protein LOC130813632 n=1 Tax=Amaranthus tricolor TaxID=29722 RepID=UPI002585CC0F|nr:uncharacterized protein LOC130813632 [Amaranthus tricolor]
MEKNGDPKKKVMVDLSPFFLLEAAGDSEGDLDDTHHHNMLKMMEFGSHDDHEEDAESCSYDVWDAHANVVTATATASTSSHIINEGRNDHHVCRGIVHGNDEYDDDENASKSEIMSTANTANSTRKCCVDSSEGKKMSEKERSRLFWETCLAS